MWDCRGQKRPEFAVEPAPGQESVWDYPRPLLARNPDVPIAWDYPPPRARFEMLQNYVSFYPGRIACFVDDERVEPQPGRFYGGWITKDVVGPFKGEPGTGHW